MREGSLARAVNVRCRAGLTHYHPVSIARDTASSMACVNEDSKGAYLTLKITPIALIALAMAFPARANLYKCFAANGSITYSDVQCTSSGSPAIEAPRPPAATVPAANPAPEHSESGVARTSEKAAPSQTRLDHTLTEMQVRAEISASVSKAFLQRNFELLEARSRDYRESKSRTPSGIWKLTTFYVARDCSRILTPIGRPYVRDLTMSSPGTLTPGISTTMPSLRASPRMLTS